MPATVSADVHRLSGRWGRLDMHALGATVTSWAPGGVEQIFTCEDAEPSPGRMWHGGIPICAPWFGSGMGLDWEVPFRHGLVSRVAWQVVHSTSGDDGATIVLRTDARSTRHLAGSDRFPADLGYELRAEADARELALSLTITSPTQPTRIEAMFHPYLAVDVPTARLAGLGGIEYRDFSDGTEGVEVASLRVDGALDRVYAAAAPATVTDASGSLEVVPEGAATAVVWNPGIVDGRFAAGEGQRFLCMEFGNAAAGAVDLPAGGSHRLGIRLTRA
ncbi:hypothetical protein [Tessaracoccus lacteus]|uniref:Glucose-6-phosphate 1-epimerase n=1 Tax=Tessaracoccus lacteus TaxID=3041766 RepID=A0ABY8PVY3_9ACTN|nr:hypothetical protein [Tessaracoccus sp. T21]WGT46604.1 hypothetical protein QH948_10680 [Tessaracoccus sp. T21]